jgi:hypothetical protein
VYLKSISGDTNDDDYELEGDAAIDLVGMGNKSSALNFDEGAGDDDVLFPLHAARDGIWRNSNQY